MCNDEQLSFNGFRKIICRSLFSVGRTRNGCRIETAIDFGFRCGADAAARQNFARGA